MDTLKRKEIQRNGGSIPPEYLEVYLLSNNITSFAINHDEFYFEANGVGRALGNKNLKQFKGRIPDKHKHRLGDIAMGVPPRSTPFNSQPNSIYLDETGMWLSILEGDLESCRELRLFIAEEVLPEIARTGSFVGRLQDEKLIPFLIIKKDK